jgi:cell division protein FtsI (penicillin-binding protein 3)
MVCLAVFAAKLVLIQIFKSAHLASLADKQHNYFIELEPIRGTIFDRNLRPLAFNVSVPSLFANPKAMTSADKEKVLNQLPSILHVSRGFLEDRLSRNKYFVWIERKISKEAMERIEALRIKGLGFRKESKRFYPNRELSAHVIGFAGQDNRGLEGLELFYDHQLKGHPGQIQILRDARQRELMIEKLYIAPQDGLDIVLTIDETIQYIAEQSLFAAVKEFNAKAGTVIVMDVTTGEILALANYPSYDLDNVGKSDVASRTNRAVSFVYEPGSVFKIVAAAAALEEGKFKESDIIFCENGEYKIANHILHDHNPHGKLTFKEVFELSSNIGVAKIAQKLGPDTIYRYAQRFRFGQLTGINLRGEVAGMLKPTSQWSKTSIGAIPIGHEVTATPVQLVTALASIANDGVIMKPHVVKEIRDKNGEVIQQFLPTVVDRVVSVETARRVKEILKGAVETGTGKKAQIKGIEVAGKTGTAQKIENGVYSHSSYYATFMGFAPVESPKLAAIVVFDDPRPRYFGGTVSAPVFKEVVEKSLKYLDSVRSSEYASSAHINH